jgi:beta-glucosidase
VSFLCAGQKKIGQYLTYNSNFETISDLVDAGKLDIEIVDTAVSRVLRAKFEMGIFENPYPGAPESEWKKLIHSQEAVDLARELDKESIVLLENHDNALPLKKSGNIAVIGPMAHGYMNVSLDATIRTGLLLRQR